MAGFLVSLAIPTLLHRYGAIILSRLGVNTQVAPAISFLGLFIASQIALWLALRSVYALVPRSAKRSYANRVMGMLPSLAKGYVLCSLVLLLISVLPMKVPQNMVSESLVGSRMLGVASSIREAAAPIFTGAVREGLRFVTVKPKSNEVVKITPQKRGLKIDSKSENEMLRLVNKERTKRHLVPLKMDAKLRDLARAHSRDMFQRGYFAHIDPDGKDPFDRMRKFKIHFNEAGENLAMSPTVSMAHQGLMDSPGHRANILGKKYRRVGIGAYSSTIAGRMFSQEFTD